MTHATLNLAPMQWAGLKDIEDVEPVNESDLACLAEVREVLKKYGKRDRFGVALLHKHFDLAGDEVLVESTDKESRVLTVAVVKTAEARDTVGTIYQLLDGGFEAMLGCRQSCTPLGEYGHSKSHSSG